MTTAPPNEHYFLQDEPLIHVYAQEFEHAEAVIVCNQPGLDALRRAVNTLQPVEVTANDDECYHLHVILADQPEKLPSQYAAIEDVHRTPNKPEAWVYLRSLITKSVKTTEVPVPCHWWDRGLGYWCCTPRKPTDFLRIVRPGKPCPICHAELPEDGPPEEGTGSNEH